MTADAFAVARGYAATRAWLEPDPAFAVAERFCVSLTDPELAAVCRLAEYRQEREVLSCSGQSPFDAIPWELKERSQWVNWRLEKRGGKLTKVPYRADGAGRASSTDPATWSPFEKAVAASWRPDRDGIGYVFSADDPYTGVDLDARLSLEDRGTVVWLLNSYAELSHSRDGVHVLVRGSMNGHGCNRRGGIEVYEEARFFVTTGAHLPGTPPVIEARQGPLTELLELFLPAAPIRETNHRAPTPVDLDNREVLDRAIRAKNGPELEALYNGQWEGRYPSQSEADLALCTKLAFWVGRDPDRIDTLFRSSGLYREKWERPDYRENRLELAVAGCHDTYKPRGGNVS